MGDQPGVFALVEKQSGKVIGHIVFHEFDEPEIYELGWILGKEYWRRGYAYEISKALIDYGFWEMNLHRIVAETADPVKSLGLMKKLGMKLAQGDGSSVQYRCYIMALKHIIPSRHFHTGSHRPMSRRYTMTLLTIILFWIIREL